jgi:hypothetical protein
MKSFKSFLKEDGPPITKLMTKSGVAYHVHSDHAHKFKSMVDDLETSGYKIKSISSYRPGATVAGSGHRSAHADAMAIDINPGQNPHTFPHHHNYGQTDMPDIVRKDMEKQQRYNAFLCTSKRRCRSKLETSTKTRSISGKPRRKT